MIDLEEASRDELIRLVDSPDRHSQHECIGALEQTVRQVREANATLSTQVTQLTARVTALPVALEAATGSGAGTLRVSTHSRAVAA